MSTLIESPLVDRLKAEIAKKFDAIPDEQKWTTGRGVQASMWSPPTGYPLSPQPADVRLEVETPPGWWWPDGGDMHMRWLIDHPVCGVDGREVCIVIGIRSEGQRLIVEALTA